MERDRKNDERRNWILQAEIKADPLTRGFVQVGQTERNSTFVFQFSNSPSSTERYSSKK
jgi:hypothetical protein